MALIQRRKNFSRGVLIRMAIVLGAVAAILAVNADFIFTVYLRNQPTMAGYIINGGIVALFLIGLIRIVAVLLRYTREERALDRFLQALRKDATDPAEGIHDRSLIAIRYRAVTSLCLKGAPINHAALASTQVARESTSLSIPRFIHNILILTGVFGTIVSLSIALIGASNILDTPQQDPDSMGMVIHGMSTALSTTITAIVSYLIYGYFYLKLTDAQAQVLSDVEQVTLLELIPRYGNSSENLVPRVAALVKRLREVTEMMRSTQANYVAASAELHEMVTLMNERTRPVNDELKVIRGILREGFRLPEPGPKS